MTHKKNTLVSGINIKVAERVMVMLHGRGATAEDIISIAQYFNTKATHIIAPQATNHSWYPYSFMAPVNENEPWLTSSLNLLSGIMADIQREGIRSQQVYLLGFSQGACLGLEFAARNAKHYGGVIAFTGGLIGDVLNLGQYKGSFDKTTVFIGNSDKDPHVPLKRSEESKTIMEKLGAAVTMKVYPGMAHTINEDEINWVNQNILL